MDGGKMGNSPEQKIPIQLKTPLFPCGGSDKKKLKWEKKVRNLICEVNVVTAKKNNGRRESSLDINKETIGSPAAPPRLKLPSRGLADSGTVAAEEEQREKESTQRPTTERKQNGNKNTENRFFFFLLLCPREVFQSLLPIPPPPMPPPLYTTPSLHRRIRACVVFRPCKLCLFNIVALIHPTTLQTMLHSSCTPKVLHGR